MVLLECSVIRFWFYLVHVIAQSRCMQWNEHQTFDLDPKLVCFTVVFKISIHHC